MFWESRSSLTDSETFLVYGSASLSYAEVFERADALFSETRRGVVLILCERDVETVTAYIGALRAGLVPLLIDEATRADALVRYISLYAPEYIFAPKRTKLPLKWEIHAEFGKARLWHSSSSTSKSALHEGLCLLLTTSGSTGDPKTVRLTPQNIQSCTDEICNYLELDETVRALSMLPFHYSYGLSVLHSCMNSRAKFVLSSKSVLDRDFWAFIEEMRVTDFAGVPFIFEILRRMKIPDAVMQNLRCVTQAGGRLDPRITKHFSKLFSTAGVDYFTMYGQTEAGPRISYLPPEKADQKVGSVGIPLPCGRVRLAEGNVETGELVYSGPNVCMGYAFNRADLSKGDELKGELFTGDQASIDDDGFVYVVGRRNRYLKLQGQSVSLDHVEAVLQNADVASRAIGRDNLMVICHTGDEHEKISEALKVNFTVHASSVRLQAIDEFPMKSSGKPDYSILEERFL